MKIAPIAAALCLLAAGSCLADAPPKTDVARAPAPSNGLIVATDAQGGHVASGGVSMFRVHNANPKEAFGPLSAKISGGKGFRVVSNGCANGLAARETCLVSVSFRGAGAQESQADPVVSSSPSFEVRSALHGDARP